LEPVAVQDVGVRAAARGARRERLAQVRRGALCQPDDRRVDGEVEPVVVALDAGLRARRVQALADPRAMAARGLLEAAPHVVGLRLELLEAQAPRLAAQADAVRHDVDRQAALDHAEVGRRLGVDPPEPHRGDRLAGDLDRADPLLRTHARVGLEAVDREDHLVRGRRPHDELAGAVHVEDEPGPGPEAPGVEVLGAE